MATNKKAVNFTLKNTKGEETTLFDETKKGKVVLLFFPLAFTGVCTAEMCTTRDNMKMYNALNASVFGISVDSHHTLREFKKQNNLNFELLSDFNKEVSRAYDSFYKEFKGLKGVAKRSAFVINQENEIIYKEVLENSSEEPDYKKIAEALSK
ncbi:MAG TPA: redoxin domain-containing protein [Balneolaceae bacterium]|nr:redoxin domain-containing protein [Balneolaceae bacterium]